MLSIRVNERRGVVTRRGGGIREGVEGEEEGEEV